jgi:hypothetical protein
MRKSRALKTHCKHGHEYTPENTYLQNRKDGYIGRACRACMDISNKRWKDSNPEKKAEVQRKANQKWVAKNPEYFKRNDLQSLWGITLEQFNEKLAAQDGKCEICKCELIKANIDHDHSCCPTSSGKRVNRKTCGKCMRGLLCDGCNTALGRFKDSEEILQTAIDYLRKYKRTE